MAVCELDQCKRSDVIPRMVLPLSRAFFRCEYAVTEEVVVSVCVVWQEGFTFLSKENKQSHFYTKYS